SQLLRQIQIRKTESRAELAKRFTAACHELEQAGDFDYIIFNEAERLRATVERVQAIVEAERLRVNQAAVELSTLRAAR
ncbi:MAG: guanylate kinase, partial [Chloroflexota bacterium]|nr:guanylate kinase [Chloroflexota bacterium]